MSITPEDAPYRPAYVRDPSGLYYRVGGGGGGAGADEVSIGPDEPIDPAIEVWLDTDDNTAQTVVTQGVPVGTITMFGGSAAPEGWHLCNGTAHGSAALQAVIGSANSPNLLDRFVIAAGSTHAVGAVGGEASHTLTIAEMPSHAHPVGSPALPQIGETTGGGTVSRSLFGRVSADTDSLGWQALPVGGGAAHENRPPFYALTFIIKK